MTQIDYEGRKDFAVQPDRAPGTVEALDRQLERFDVTLEHLRKVPSPALSMYATVEHLSDPQPEPASQLRGRVARLSERLDQLDRIMTEIDL